MSKKTYKIQAISFSGQEDLLAAAQAAARSENRSLSNFVCLALAEKLNYTASPSLKDEFNSTPEPPSKQVSPQEVSYLPKSRGRKTIVKN